MIAGYQTLQSAWRSPEYRTLPANREFLYIRGDIAIAIAKFIQSLYGYYSLGQAPPPIGFNASLSYKLCAEMAGLGTRSLAGGILLNQKLGMPEFWVTVTTMPLIADGPLQEPVCPHPSCVKLWEQRRNTPCLEACDCISGELEEGQIKWMRYDRRICATRAQTESSSTLQRILLEASNESIPEVRRILLLGSLSHLVVGSIASGNVTAQCFECVRNCPICRRAQSLKQKKQDKLNRQQV